MWVVARQKSGRFFQHAAGGLLAFNKFLNHEPGNAKVVLMAFYQLFFIFNNGNAHGRPLIHGFNHGRIAEPKADILKHMVFIIFPAVFF